MIIMASPAPADLHPPGGTRRGSESPLRIHHGYACCVLHMEISYCELFASSNGIGKFTSIP